MNAPFALLPLSRTLKIMAFLSPFLSSSSVFAQTSVNGPVTIEATTPLDSYRVGSNGVLTANGATTLQISTVTGAQLTLNGSQVSAATGTAVSLTGANALITGSQLTGGADGMGMGNNTAQLVGSTATVIGSTITATNRGVNAGSLANLTLEHSAVTATGTNGRGVEMFDSTVKASDSTITGQQYGIRMRADPCVPSSNLLTLEGTRVEGVTDSALIVGTPTGAPATATIFVKNGSTLTGGNGKIMELINGSTANMTVDNSQLLGDIFADAGSTAGLVLQNNATLTGRLQNVASFSLASGGQWTMVENSQVGNVSMNGGSVRFGDAASFYTLSLASLSGSGTFMMDVDFGGAATDFLDITGNATGSHSLLIGSTGTDPLSDTSLHVVHAAAGDASFSLAGGAVDLGAWSYDLIKHGANDWYLDTATRTISPGAQTVMALFNTAPTVWYGELSTLRSRMGELRMDQARSGGWMRTYGNKFNVADASGFGYQQVQSGVALGADGKLPVGSGQWLAGVMIGQSTSDLSLDHGASGKVDSYSLGAYSTWLDSESGYYVDGVIKLNQFKNKARVNLSDGSRTRGNYDNLGVGASLELGRHIKLDNGYFLEPYTQLAGLVVQGKDYELDNGMHAEGDRSRSLLGKVATTAGRSFDVGKGRTLQPYVRVAVAHEFVNRNEVKVNDNMFNNDLSGSRGELGAGVSVSLSDNLQLHADFDYSNSDAIEQPWGASAGLRYSW
ncbi:Outer membrane autotransporter barrel [Pseudomonas syringae pv. broussonetiae]|uniref:Autotransporter barrel protein with pertacin-like passenger domain n=1 Tax=Pseudomonas savastanoi TaxID=29438 RepID=A0A3M5KHP8_PSESS|nr:autotransporter outer membrane beta-barrel domain-containing protein [Pseudomonas savastanoi]KPW67774.1 Outer membrane autotransporter barrel [Pseudomonas syringae pv. broussonetiae]RMS18673.1 Outer membrane autotransporter barrel [Pseudomonas savastanoi]RMT35107.1 Autotransporter barrel protein with pertacin-like passenger domain [Pseudomonas savastanoi]